MFCAFVYILHDFKKYSLILGRMQILSGIRYKLQKNMSALNDVSASKTVGALGIYPEEDPVDIK